MPPAARSWPPASIACPVERALNPRLGARGGGAIEPAPVCDDLGCELVDLAALAARAAAQHLEGCFRVDIETRADRALGLLDDHAAIERVLQLLGAGAPELQALGGRCFTELGHRDNPS